MARPPLYHWQQTQVGREGLCLILRYAYTKATPEQLCAGSPGDYGISAEEMRKWVLERLPELEKQHFEKTGLPLTGNKMMSRLYNMYDLLPDGRRKPSSEHPTVHEDLQLVWNQMKLF